MSATDQKSCKGKGMDGFIARTYDRNARKYIMGQYRSWAAMVSSLLPKDARVLEIAPGPGYLAIELARSGIRSITGLDISRTFVELAREHARETQVDVRFLQGNASAMPFADGSYTHVLCTSAFKNFADPLGALKEMHRVLTPGGIVWLSDMRRDVTDAEIDAYVTNVMKLRGVNGLFTRMTFKQMLRKRAYTKESLLALVSRTPLKVDSFEQETMEFRVTMKK